MGRNFSRLSPRFNPDSLGAISTAAAGRGAPLFRAQGIA
jgi:hypothetical protein